jgi:serine phosphatase RsbU (regulator of sigma subunit)
LLSKQRDQLEEKNKLIEEKNKEIADSIAYAKYIQDAILPTLRINQLLPEAFLLFLPKDIVSGDFYWFEKDEEHIYMIAADCTGHGIPGAFMSMIGTMLLNEIYNEKKVRTPGGILTSLNNLLQLSLKQTENPEMNIRNGMDIIIIKLNKNTGSLEFASANRPLYIIRKQSDKVESFIADKTAIGGVTDYYYKFKTETVLLEKGDCFYLFSDGYADQFGGTEGKKLMTKNFKKQLLEISNLPMQDQRDKLASAFNSWKGSYEQVDDVLVLGGRV